MPKWLPINAVAVAEEIGRRGVVRQGVDELLSGPGGGGVLGHVEVDDAPAVMGEHDENEEDAEAGGRHGEEIDRDQVEEVVGEERPPGLKGPEAALRHEPGDGALGNLDAKLEELSCVQSNADVFSGDSPAGARASSPIAWMAGRRVTDVLEPIDNPLARRVSECPGRNRSERTGSPETQKLRRPSVCELREGRRSRRRLAGVALSLRRGGSGGTETRTRRATGEALLAPSGKRRKGAGPITSGPGKWADGERVAEGPGVAVRRGNARGAKGPCCSATPPTRWKAGAV